MNVFYIGDDGFNSSSRHRADALRRLGHDVMHVNPYFLLSGGRLRMAWHYRTGYRFISPKVTSFILKKLANNHYDVAWVDNGEIVSGPCIKKIRQNCRRVLNCNLDDPTGGRDAGRWHTFFKALPLYDQCVVVRRASESEYPQYGARSVLRVWMGADEVVHSPKMISETIYQKWKSEVVFVGTWMPERGAFMLDLIRSGVPLSIWGNRWHKAREWPLLRGCWRGPGLLGDEYSYAIQCSKICLGLLSKGNRDLHTTRSLEIPSLGGVLCAERTVEHLELYEDGKEAVFWNDSAECVQVIKRLLANPDECSRIATAGRGRFWENGIRNETMVSRILSSL